MEKKSKLKVLKLVLHHQKRYVHGLMVKLKNLKLLTIEH